MHLAWRVAFIMLLGGWLVLPADVGLGVMLGRLFIINPAVAGLLGLVLIIVINTLLPLRLRQYKRFTQWSLGAMTAILTFQAFSRGLFKLEDYPVWLMCLTMAAVFILIAWPMIANRLWQWVHFQRAVDPSGADLHHT